MTKKISYIFVVFAALLWGSTPAVAKLLLAELNNLQVLFFNNFFACLGLLAAVLIRRQSDIIKNYTRKDYVIFAAMGLLGTFLYNLFLISALEALPAQEAFLINYLWPVMAVIFATVILKEKINLRKALGLLSSFIGVAIVVTQGNFSSFHLNSAAGVLLATAGAVVFGLFSVLGKRYKYEQFTDMMFYYVFGTTYSLLALLLFSNLPSLSMSQFFGLIWLGTFTSGLAFVFWFLALEYGDTAKMSNMILLTPFISLIYIHFLVGEKILFYSIVGLIIIVLGIVIQSTGKSIRNFYTWKKLDVDCSEIAQWAKDKKFKNIYGIPRGGLIIAVKLSHLLEIPVVLSAGDISSSTLVVDDIVDEGNTLSRFLDLLHCKVMTASLYLGPNPTIKPDFFLNKKVGWVVFPWETRASSRYDGTF